MSLDATERAAVDELAQRLCDDDARVTRNTMMGFPCLRLDCSFFACVERTTGNLIVKLPIERVHDLVSPVTDFEDGG